MYLPTSIRSLLSGESESRTWDESSFNTVMTVVISWLAFWNSPAARSFSNIESGPLTIPMRIELTEPSSGLKLFTYKTTEWASVAWKNSSRWCGETKLNKKALPPKVFHLNGRTLGFHICWLRGQNHLVLKKVHYHLKVLRLISIDLVPTHFMDWTFLNFIFRTASKLKWSSLLFKSQNNLVKHKNNIMHIKMHGRRNILM